MTQARRILILVGLVLATGAAIFLYNKLEQFRVITPDYPKPERTLWLEQNWTPKERDWYHHADQGAVTFGIPYEWFVALEQPVLSLGEAGLLKDQDYLDRFGFIPSPNEELPVGFAKGEDFIDPTTKKPWLNPRTGTPMKFLGLTCAACHTGRLTYEGTEIYIDGANARIELDKLRKALAVSLFYTRYVPFRFDRFVTRLFGEGALKKAKTDTRTRLLEVLRKVEKVQKLDASVAQQSVTEGFGRLDALNRIGNQVFGLDLDNDANYAATSAPVRYPPVWDASWFDWVQYNGSIMQPMVRNAGEALGLRALINLVTNDPPLFASTVNVSGLFSIESLLAGKQPDSAQGFSGLKAPQWPENILPKIDRARAAKGAELYKDLCQGCHLPPVESSAFYAPDLWTVPNAAGESYLRLKLVSIDDVGTDPAQAEGMHKRKVTTPPMLGINQTGFGEALGIVVEKTVNRWYDDRNVPKNVRAWMNGFRENLIRAPLAYKARPLDGIWATAPYLHNGSVPTLYALLSPDTGEERPKSFTLGHREFDPVNVGIVYDILPGGTPIDTKVAGNSNRGHVFDDKPLGGGIIGRLLSEEERRDLVEYLKTL